MQVKVYVLDLFHSSKLQVLFLLLISGSTVCNLEEGEAVDFTDVAKCGRTILVGSTAIGTNIQILNSQIDHKRSWMMKDSHYGNIYI